MILITVSLLSCLLLGCGKKGDEAASPKAESDQSSIAEHSEKPRGDTPALQPVRSGVKEVEEHESEDDEEERQLMVKEAC